MALKVLHRSAEASLLALKDLQVTDEFKWYTEDH